jgi:hypothetical protein
MKLIVTFLLLFFCSFARQSALAHNPTWTEGIACIVYSHCTSCHNPKGIAPFSLMTYNDVYQNRFSIAASVQSGSMPPFPAKQAKQKYAHANTLTQHEVDEIVHWVNNFAPLGDANNIPAAPTYASNFQIENPDFVAKIPTYTITSNNDVYRMFVVPVNNLSQQTIQQIEVFPGNREIVHHALVFQDTSSIPYNYDQNDPLPGYSAFGGTGSPTSKLITGYTPGQAAFSFAPGFGAVLLPNSYIIIQMHYPGGVSGELDSTQVRIQYGSSSLRNVNTIAALNHNSTLTNGPLFIPAGTVKTFYNQVNNNTNRTITGIMPHMHLIGKSIKAYFVTPTNDTVHLVDIPEWDFHWQYFYQFQKPILIPAGSIVYGEATYDNTTNNPHNPNNPPQDVSLGEGTTDEMFLIYMNLSNFQPGDTSIIIDTSNHFVHNSTCYQFQPTNNNKIEVYPNPAIEYLNITGMTDSYLVKVFNNEGKIVLSKENRSGQPLFIGHLSSGLYYLQLKNQNNEIFYKKVVIR